MVAVPPTERLPRPLPSLTVGLQGGDSQDLLAGVVEMVVVEVRKVMGLGVDLASGAAVLRRRHPLGDVGRVAGGSPHSEGRLLVVIEVSQPRHGVAQRAQRTQRVRIVRADGDRTTRETDRGARTKTKDWKTVLVLVRKC